MTAQAEAEAQAQAQAQAQELRDAVVRHVQDSGSDVDQLLTRVAKDQGVDLEVAASAMWDLVEASKLDYGVDARVRPMVSA